MPPLYLKQGGRLLVVIDSMRVNLKKQRKREFHYYRALDRKYNEKEYRNLQTLIPHWAFQYKIEKHKKKYANGTFGNIGPRYLSKHLYNKRDSKASFDLMYVCSLRDVPRYLNDNNEDLRKIAQWRIQIGK